MIQKRLHCFWAVWCSALPASRCCPARTPKKSAVLRMKDCIMQTVNKVQEEAGDILADAKAINESRAAEAAQEVIEDTAEQPAEQTAQ